MRMKSEYIHYQIRCFEKMQRRKFVLANFNRQSKFVFFSLKMQDFSIIFAI